MMEIIQSINGNSPSSGLAIFECTGDNAFAWVFAGTLAGPTSTGEKVIADLDGDGSVEIALCGSPGWLHIFESPCNNTWILRHREWTGLYNAYTMEGGRDTDGNGKAEIFVMGNIGVDSTSYYCTMIYESCGDNCFVRVATLIMDEGVGAGSSALCNLDAAGNEEYLMRSGGPGIRVFRATVRGTWDFVGTAYGPGGGVYAFDLNQTAFRK